MKFTITEVDFQDMSDDELAPVLALANKVDKETQPRNEGLTIDEFRAFTGMPGMVQNRYLAHDPGGRLAGMAATRYDEDGSNADQLHCTIRVAPGQRRQRAGTALLRRCADLAAELGRDRIIGFTFDTVPAGEAFAAAVRTKTALDMHMNALAIADLDRTLMEEWVAQGSEKAQGYSVVVYEGRWPDAILDNMAKLYHVIDRDSPQPEGHEPRTWSAELVAQFLDQFLPACDSIMAYAEHVETGEPAAMSHLIRRHSDPKTWIVTTTMVEPAHRGRSIGKWVKGAVNLNALEAWKGGEYQETSNAFTNDAMLAINRAMGFQHEFTATLVEARRSDVEEFVAGRY